MGISNDTDKNVEGDGDLEGGSDESDGRSEVPDNVKDLFVL